GYCNWDDYHLITANHSIKDLSWKNLKEMFSSGYVGTYIPLTIFSFAFEYKFFNLNPRVSHTINLIFHLFNVVLVFWLIYLLSNNLTIAFLVSLLFGIHPLHVESVAWATERKDMLYSFFYLISVIFYLHYRRREKRTFFILSVILFVLSILSKPMAVTLPVILLLFDYYFEKRLSVKQVYSKIAYFIPAIFFGVINIFFQGSGTIPLVNYLKHFFVFCYNLLFYLYKIIIPINLSCFYPYPENFEKSLPLSFLISPLVIASFVYFVIQTKRFTHKIVFGVLFFVIAILPVSQIVPLVAPAIAADRYTYIPSVGLFFIAGLVLEYLYRKRFRYSNPARFVLYICMFLVFTLYAVLSFNRCKVWKDSVTLWTDVLKRYPSSDLAYNNRGNAYNLLGQYDNAIADFNRAIEINPSLELSYFDRGTVYEHLGFYDKAISDFTNALNIQPDFVMGYVDRGAIYSKIGEYHKAYNDLKRALQLKPNLPEAHYNLGVLYFRMKNYNLAIESYHQALKLDPYFAVVYVSLADIYFIYGDYERAIENYTKSIKIDSLLADAYYNRAVTFAKLEHWDHALADYSKTIQLEPDYAEAYNNRGNIYFRFGEIENALKDYDRAIQLDPEYAQAYYNRALVYQKIGDFEKVLQDLNTLRKFGVMVDSNLIKLLKKGK
ncbi:MAG: tetratricopeptide repeat protein, partial [candidate division WOR-3 bacterium]